MRKIARLLSGLVKLLKDARLWIFIGSFVVSYWLFFRVLFPIGPREIAVIPTLPDALLSQEFADVLGSAQLEPVISDDALMSYEEWEMALQAQAFDIVLYGVERGQNLVPAIYFLGINSATSTTVPTKINLEFPDVWPRFYEFESFEGSLSSLEIRYSRFDDAVITIGAIVFGFGIVMYFTIHSLLKRIWIRLTVQAS